MLYVLDKGEVQSMPLWASLPRYLGTPSPIKRR